jgi:hypothetical protein
MNWYKRAEVKETDSFIYETYKAVQDILSGNWTVKVINDQKDSKVYWLQRMLTFKLSGKGVVKPTDYFYTFVRIWAKRQAGKVVHPHDGSYEGSTGWENPTLNKIKDYTDYATSGEELKRRWDALYNMKPDDASVYDSEHGNRLFEIFVRVFGYKDENADDIELGRTEEVDSPAEIAEYIKSQIMRYYFEGDDGDDEVEPIDPTGGGYMEPEVTYDQIDDPALTSNLTSSKNWYKKTLTSDC